LALSFPLPALRDPQRPLRELLVVVLHRLEALERGISRIAFVHHDARTDLLATYVAMETASVPASSRPPFEPRALATVPSLVLLRDRPQARVLNDLERDLDPTSEHSRWLLAQGWRASLTLPLFSDHRLLGFLFLDSGRAGAFDAQALAVLEPHLEVLLLGINHHFRGLASLHGALAVVLEMAALRDQETATHQERVSSYSRLIALELERERALPSDFSANLHRFAALHDVGKVGIPDRILLKPGPLNREERQVMENHVRLGLALIERVITAMDLQQDPRITLLREVVAHHHERLDGSGYPAGLRGEQVSLAGRIVAVADLFDALTQARAYKSAFPESHAVQVLRAMVQEGKLDGDCVEALLRNDVQRRAILLGHCTPQQQSPSPSPPSLELPPGAAGPPG
jgi:HD-GYP domain-containing protein (c-di-GMP phosphodiesterase class II)